MTFLDLFAGIGGFRRGLERSGHVCVGHVEIDKYANKSYIRRYTYFLLLFFKRKIYANFNKWTFNSIILIGTDMLFRINVRIFF